MPVIRGVKHHMKKLCRNCHFLAKELPEPNTGRRLSFSLSKDERGKALHGEVDFIDDRFCLKCQMGVWDEGVSPGKEQRLHRLNHISRRDKCFFFPHDPGMLFGAAKELQKREQENRQLKRSNLYTRIGLWIAALALFASAIIGIFQATK